MSYSRYIADMNKNNPATVAAKLNEFCEAMLASNQRTLKEAVLESYLNDADVTEFLAFVYNPFVVTGISTKKWKKAKDRDAKPTVTLTYFSDLYNYIKSNNTGKDENVDVVWAFAKSLGLAGYFLIENIVTKNFQLGIDKTTVNKIYGKDFIPIYQVQLANRWQDRKDRCLGQEIVITEKIDGSRLQIVKSGDSILFFNRSGIQIKGLIDLIKEVQALDFDGVLDGELYATGTFAQSKDAYKETMKRSRINGDKTGLKIRAYDYLTLEEFENQKGTVPYLERRNRLTEIVSKHKSDLIEVLPPLYHGIADEKAIDAIVDQEIAKGHEGIMVNVADAVYKFGRGDCLLKYKKFQDFDLKVTGFQEGTNKYEGMLGALIVDYKGFSVNVGTGFSDENRVEIWNNKEEYIGRIVTVKAFESTENANGGESLRFPAFVDFREDLA